MFGLISLVASKEGGSAVLKPNHQNSMSDGDTDAVDEEDDTE